MRLVFDACSLINLNNGSAFATVLRLPAFEWNVGLRPQPYIVLSVTTTSSTFTTAFTFEKEVNVGRVSAPFVRRMNRRGYAPRSG